MSTQTKVCNYCKHELSLSAFSINQRTGELMKVCDSCRAHKSEYDSEHREERREAHRQWHQSPAGKLDRLRTHRNPTKIPGLIDTLSPEQVADLMARQPRCMACGTNVGLGIDHVIPVSKGGHNVITNLQMLCKRCNMVKHAADPEEMHAKLNTPPDYKFCPTCRTDLPISEFSPNSRTRDGLKDKCKDCNNAYQRSYMRSKRM